MTDFINPPHARSGFTLAEIAFSLVVLMIAVITMFLVLPTGVRTQQMVRYQTLAAAKAMEMLDQFRDGTGPGIIDDSRDLDKEGMFPWDCPTTYRAMAPDLECSLESLRASLKPLPEAIAHRIDSDKDEIENILNSGGRLYYFTAAESTDVYEPRGKPRVDDNWDQMHRKMVVAVSGSSQLNAVLYNTTTKVGPYQSFYPSPPTHGPLKMNRSYDGMRNKDGDLNKIWSPEEWIRKKNINYDALCRQDPDIGKVMVSNENETYTFTTNGSSHTEKFGFLPYQFFILGSPSLLSMSEKIGNDPTSANFQRAQRGACAYVVSALWYAERKGITWGELSALSESAAPAFAAAHAGNASHVLAMRYLAHAASCLTRFYPNGFPAAGASLGGSPSIALVLDGTNYSNRSVTLTHITGWREAGLRLGVAHADLVGPYDWSAPRPLNRQVMMDHPLVHLDPWSAPVRYTVNAHVSGDFPPYITGGKVTHEQWRAVYPEVVRNPGLPFSYPGRLHDNNAVGVNLGTSEAGMDGTVDQRDTPGTPPWNVAPPRPLDSNGDGRLDESDQFIPANGGGMQAGLGPVGNFTLTAPFAPSERCRQLVFWVVDWQSYEDFETAPSAAIDACRYPMVATQILRADRWRDRNPSERQTRADRSSGVMGSLIRNPELVAIFREPSMPLGVPLSRPGYLVSGINDWGFFPMNVGFNGTLPDMKANRPQVTYPGSFGDSEMWNMKVFLGRFGVNRNGVIADRAGPVTEYPSAGWDGARPAELMLRGLVDRGPLKKSVRLRASTVARFNFYDPRIQGQLHR